MTWRVHEITADLRLQVTREMPPIDADLDREVSRLWEMAQTRAQGRLFNGQVFSSDKIGATSISGHWTEFRRVVAQMEDHRLHARLGVRATAINGVIIGPDGIVLGRRPIGALYQGGEWQTAPAGSIDPSCVGTSPDGRGTHVDVVRQLLIELEEEIGLPAEAVSDPRPFCLVEHPGSHVLDLGIIIKTGLDGEAIRAAHGARGNGEYVPLEIVPVALLPGFLAEAGDAVAGQTRIFLEQLGFCGPDALAVDS